ncbi:hypothetical protein [Chondromyces apiculatus]|uniref:Uncharacterized protein n=1 Tax=Chondromyces apiculatus DSM 436 TaxID=1192034 RepID=A0A017T568_9BACT|nr:hypothetical protein [Chondromyces apiculatus]EYF04127.1 Hypothetical protein CAP_4810 [Chondromyces apiculatus DSM 436]
MRTKISSTIGLFSLLSLVALGSAGCLSGETESSQDGADHVIAEVQLSATRRIVFVDEGEGRVGVAEVGARNEAPLVTTMIGTEQATPLEIFLATAPSGEVAPLLLLDNHEELATLQGRQDLTPRLEARLAVPLGPLAAIINTGTGPCTEAGWEGPSGIWGSGPDGSWDAVFANSTSIYSNNTTYPAPKQINPLSTWNGSSGTYHTHGACIASDAGADNQITFAMYHSNPGGSIFALLHTEVLSEGTGGNGEWVTYTDFFANNIKTKSQITNVGNAAASFRHSAGAWVPFPG